MQRVRKWNKNYHSELKNITQKLLGESDDDPKSHIYTNIVNLNMNMNLNKPMFE